jgi:hypothetical protein
MKRPRHWHHKGKPVWKIWRNLQRDRERAMENAWLALKGYKMYEDV